MNYKSFDASDIIKNTVKTFPDNKIIFNSGNVYITSLNQILATDDKNKNLVAGNPLNLGNASSEYARSFIQNSVNETAGYLFPINQTTENRYSKTVAGEFSITAYPTSSITVMRFQSNEKPLYLNALRNTLNWNTAISPEYDYSNFLNKDIAIINIPSVFYGSTIQRGSINISYYYTGSYVAALHETGDGKLVQLKDNELVSAGIVLYDEGIILLTGSWDLPNANTTKWNMFASGSDENIYSSGSFVLKFKGTNYINSITMLAHAEKNEFNSTANSTFIDHSQGDYVYITTGSNTFRENPNTLIKNTIKTNYSTVSGSFKKQTFINKIGIYDENKNLIAIAKLSTPVKKNNEREYTFKIKVDT